MAIDASRGKGLPVNTGTPPYLGGETNTQSEAPPLKAKPTTALEPAATFETTARSTSAPDKAAPPSGLEPAKAGSSHQATSPPISAKLSALEQAFASELSNPTQQGRAALEKMLLEEIIPALDEATALAREEGPEQAQAQATVSMIVESLTKLGLIPETQAPKSKALPKKAQAIIDAAQAKNPDGSPASDIGKQLAKDSIQKTGVTKEALEAYIRSTDLKTADPSWLNALEKKETPPASASYSAYAVYKAAITGRAATLRDEATQLRAEAKTKQGDQASALIAQAKAFEKEAKRIEKNMARVSDGRVSTQAQYYVRTKNKPALLKLEATWQKKIDDLVAQGKDVPKTYERNLAHAQSGLGQVGSSETDQKIQAARQSYNKELKAYAKSKKAYDAKTKAGPNTDAPPVLPKPPVLTDPALLADLEESEDYLDVAESNYPQIKFEPAHAKSRITNSANKSDLKTEQRDYERTLDPLSPASATTLEVWKTDLGRVALLKVLLAQVEGKPRPLSAADQDALNLYTEELSQSTAKAAGDTVGLGLSLEVTTAQAKAGHAALEAMEQAEKVSQKELDALIVERDRLKAIVTSPFFVPTAKLIELDAAAASAMGTASPLPNPQAQLDALEQKIKPLELASQDSKKAIEAARTHVKKLDQSAADWTALAASEDAYMKSPELEKTVKKVPNKTLSKADEAREIRAIPKGYERALDPFASALASDASADDLALELPVARVDQSTALSGTTASPLAGIFLQVGRDARENAGKAITDPLKSAQFTASSAKAEKGAALVDVQRNGLLTFMEKSPTSASSDVLTERSKIKDDLETASAIANNAAAQIETAQKRAGPLSPQEKQAFTYYEVQALGSADVTAAASATMTGLMPALGLGEKAPKNLLKAIDLLDRVIPEGSKGQAADMRQGLLFGMASDSISTTNLIALAPKSPLQGKTFSQTIQGANEVVTRIETNDLNRSGAAENSEDVKDLRVLINAWLPPPKFFQGIAITGEARAKIDTMLAKGATTAASQAMKDKVDDNISGLTNFVAGYVETVRSGDQGWRPFFYADKITFMNNTFFDAVSANATAYGETIKGGFNSIYNMGEQFPIDIDWTRPDDMDDFFMLVGGLAGPAPLGAEVSEIAARHGYKLTPDELAQIAEVAKTSPAFDMIRTGQVSMLDLSGLALRQLPDLAVIRQEDAAGGGFQTEANKLLDRTNTALDKVRKEQWDTWEYQLITKGIAGGLFEGGIGGLLGGGAISVAGKVLQGTGWLAKSVGLGRAVKGAAFAAEAVVGAHTELKIAATGSQLGLRLWTLGSGAAEIFLTQQAVGVVTSLTTKGAAWIYGVSEKDAATWGPLKLLNAIAEAAEMGAAGNAAKLASVFHECAMSIGLSSLDPLLEFGTDWSPQTRQWISTAAMYLVPAGMGQAAIHTQLKAAQKSAGENATSLSKELSSLGHGPLDKSSAEAVYKQYQLSSDPEGFVGGTEQRVKLEAQLGKLIEETGVAPDTALAMAQMTLGGPTRALANIMTMPAGEHPYAQASEALAAAGVPAKDIPRLAAHYVANVASPAQSYFAPTQNNTAVDRKTFDNRVEARVKDLRNQLMAGGLSQLEAHFNALDCVVAELATEASRAKDDNHQSWAAAASKRLSEEQKATAQEIIELIPRPSRTEQVHTMLDNALAKAPPAGLLPPRDFDSLYPYSHVVDANGQVYKVIRTEQGILLGSYASPGEVVPVASVQGLRAPTDADLSAKSRDMIETLSIAQNISFLSTLINTSLVDLKGPPAKVSAAELPAIEAAMWRYYSDRVMENNAVLADNVLSGAVLTTAEQASAKQAIVYALSVERPVMSANMVRTDGDALFERAQTALLGAGIKPEQATTLARSAVFESMFNSFFKATPLPLDWPPGLEPQSLKPVFEAATAYLGDPALMKAAMLDLATSVEAEAAKLRAKHGDSPNLEHTALMRVLVARAKDAGFITPGDPTTRMTKLDGIVSPEEFGAAIQSLFMDYNFEDSAHSSFGHMLQWILIADVVKGPLAELAKDPSYPKDAPRTPKELMQWLGKSPEGGKIWGQVFDVAPGWVGVTRTTGDFTSPENLGGFVVSALLDPAALVATAGKRDAIALQRRSERLEKAQGTLQGALSSLPQAQREAIAAAVFEQDLLLFTKVSVDLVAYRKTIREKVGDLGLIPPVDSTVLDKALDAYLGALFPAKTDATLEPLWFYRALGLSDPATQKVLTAQMASSLTPDERVAIRRALAALVDTPELASLQAKMTSASASTDPATRAQAQLDVLRGLLPKVVSTAQAQENVSDPLPNPPWLDAAPTSGVTDAVFSEDALRLVGGPQSALTTVTDRLAAFREYYDEGHAPTEAEWSILASIFKEKGVAQGKLLCTLLRAQMEPAFAAEIMGFAPGSDAQAQLSSLLQDPSKQALVTRLLALASKPPAAKSDPLASQRLAKLLPLMQKPLPSDNIRFLRAALEAGPQAAQHARILLELADEDSVLFVPEEIRDYVLNHATSYPDERFKGVGQVTAAMVLQVASLDTKQGAEAKALVESWLGKDPITNKLLTSFAIFLEHAPPSVQKSLENLALSASPPKISHDKGQLPFAKPLLGLRGNIDPRLYLELLATDFGTLTSGFQQDAVYSLLPTLKMITELPSKAERDTAIAALLAAPRLLALGVSPAAAYGLCLTPSSIFTRAIFDPKTPPQSIATLVALGAAFPFGDLAALIPNIIALSATEQAQLRASLSLVSKEHRSQVLTLIEIGFPPSDDPNRAATIAKLSAQIIGVGSGTSQPTDTVLAIVSAMDPANLDRLGPALSTLLAIDGNGLLTILAPILTSADKGTLVRPGDIEILAAIAKHAKPAELVTLKKYLTLLSDPVEQAIALAAFATHFSNASSVTGDGRKTPAVNALISTANTWLAVYKKDLGAGVANPLAALLSLGIDAAPSFDSQALAAAMLDLKKQIAEELTPTVLANPPEAKHQAEVLAWRYAYANRSELLARLPRDPEGKQQALAEIKKELAAVFPAELCDVAFSAVKEILLAEVVTVAEAPGVTILLPHIEGTGPEQTAARERHERALKVVAFMAKANGINEQSFSGGEKSRVLLIHPGGVANVGEILGPGRGETAAGMAHVETAMGATKLLTTFAPTQNSSYADFETLVHELGHLFTDKGEKIVTSPFTGKKVSFRDALSEIDAFLVKQGQGASIYDVSPTDYGRTNINELTAELVENWFLAALTGGAPQQRSTKSPAWPYVERLMIELYTPPADKAAVSKVAVSESGSASRQALANFLGFSVSKTPSKPFPIKAPNNTSSAATDEVKSSQAKPVETPTLKPFVSQNEARKQEAIAYLKDVLGPNFTEQKANDLLKLAGWPFIDSVTGWPRSPDGTPQLTAAIDAAKAGALSFHIEIDVANLRGTNLALIAAADGNEKLGRQAADKVYGDMAMIIQTTLGKQLNGVELVFCRHGGDELSVQVVVKPGSKVTQEQVQQAMSDAQAAIDAMVREIKFKDAITYKNKDEVVSLPAGSSLKDAPHSKKYPDGSPKPSGTGIYFDVTKISADDTPAKITSGADQKIEEQKSGKTANNKPPPPIAEAFEKQDPRAWVGPTLVKDSLTKRMELITGAPVGAGLSLPQTVGFVEHAGAFAVDPATGFARADELFAEASAAGISSGWKGTETEVNLYLAQHQNANAFVIDAAILNLSALNPALTNTGANVVIGELSDAFFEALSPLAARGAQIMFYRLGGGFRAVVISPDGAISQKEINDLIGNAQSKLDLTVKAKIDGLKKKYPDLDLENLQAPTASGGSVGTGLVASAKPFRVTPSVKRVETTRANLLDQEWTPEQRYAIMAASTSPYVTPESLESFAASLKGLSAQAILDLSNLRTASVVVDSDAKPPISKVVAGTDKPKLCVPYGVLMVMADMDPLLARQFRDPVEFNKALQAVIGSGRSDADGLSNPTWFNEFLAREYGVVFERYDIKELSRVLENGPVIVTVKGAGGPHTLEGRILRDATGQPLFDATTKQPLIELTDTTGAKTQGTAQELIKRNDLTGVFGLVPDPGFSLPLDSEVYGSNQTRSPLPFGSLQLKDGRLCFVQTTIVDPLELVNWQREGWEFSGASNGQFTLQKYLPVAPGTEVQIAAPDQPKTGALKTVTATIMSFDAANGNVTVSALDPKGKQYFKTVDPKTDIFRVSTIVPDTKPTSVKVPAQAAQPPTPTISTPTGPRWIGLSATKVFARTTARESFTNVLEKGVAKGCYFRLMMPEGPVEFEIVDVKKASLWAELTRGETATLIVRPVGSTVEIKLPYSSEVLESIIDFAPPGVGAGQTVALTSDQISDGLFS